MRAQFRKKEELAEKPNNNQRVPGADEALSSSPNPLLRKKQEVCEKPNRNLLVSGAQEAPLSARVKPQQEVTAKPNMFDVQSGDYNWKYIAGDPTFGGGQPQQHNAQSHNQSGVRSFSAQRRQSDASPREQQQHHQQLAVPSPRQHHHVPEPLPQSFQARLPVTQSQDSQPAWAAHNPEPARRLPPLTEAQTQSGPITQPLPEPHNLYASQAPPPMQQAMYAYDGMGYPTVVPRMPAGYAAMMPQQWSAVSDLERLIARNQQDAQTSFLRV